MVLNNFVAKLNKEDLEVFVNAECDELQIYSKPNVNKQTSYIRFFRGGYGPSPEFKFDDFHFVGINSFSSFNFSSEWRKFLHKKFGEEYQNSLTKFAEDQKNEIVNSLLY